MKVVLESESQNGIRSIDMKDGQIGVIVDWNTFPGYLGKIVQRFGPDLITLGAGEQKGWKDYFNQTGDNEEAYRVVILSPGTILRIVEDEE